MPNFREVQRMLKEARTPAEKAEALRALQENVSPQMANAHMVTMSKGSQANAVRLGNLVREGQNPEVYERLKKLSGG